MKTLFNKLVIIFTIFSFSFINSCNNIFDTPPSVETGDFIENETGNITLNGTVNPHGSWTMVWFEIGETTSYGEDVSATEVMYGGTETVEVSAECDVLIEYNKTYHYRIAAENEIGTSYGNDKTFIISAPCKNCQQITYDYNGNVVYSEPSKQYCGEELLAFEAFPDVQIGEYITKWECQ